MLKLNLKKCNLFSDAGSLSKKKKKPRMLNLKMPSSINVYF